MTENPAAADGAKGSYSRRSWYMPAADAAALAKAVEDLHFETRLSKGEVLGLIVRAGLEHLDEVREAVRTRP